VKVDGDAERKVRINVSRYRHFDHGYALTVHKAQGRTVNRCFVFASANFDANLSYVAMSRHKMDVRLFWSEDVFGDQKGLIERLSRAPTASNALDYVLAHDLHGGAVRSPFGESIDHDSVTAQRQQFVRELEGLSDAELSDWRERVTPDAERELAKPADMAPTDERLQKLSAAVDEAHDRWIEASTPYHKMRKAFIEERTKSTAKEPMSEADAERLWETKGRKSKEARAAFDEMVPAFDARDKAIASLQKLHRRSRSTQKAAEAAREHNLDVRRSRDMLHLIDREIEGRRVEQLQRQLDASEFNQTQRLRMWHDAAQNQADGSVELAYALDGPLKNLWSDLRTEERLASSARYELSGIVATRGAWFAPIEEQLPADRQGLARAVDDARQSYQDAVKNWGLWRAEHSVAEAHAARRGEGDGASAYRDLVVAERTHGRAQRTYMEQVSREELSQAETEYVKAATAWEAYRKSHPQEVKEAYKGEGEVGRHWRAEREAYDKQALWERDHDWRTGRGRHHIFPQPEHCGSRDEMRRREAAALELGEAWEGFKAKCTDEQIEQARQGKGEGGELYEEMRITFRERQHSRHEYRITRTEEELLRVERQCSQAHRDLLPHLSELSSIEQAVCDRGSGGGLWRCHQELDAERQQLEERLDKLLRVKRTLQTPEIPTGEELLRQWQAAEDSVARATSEWQGAQGHERRQARLGVGDHAEAYDAYRAALARRDALRLPVVRGFRTYELGVAETRHIGALDRLAAKPELKSHAQDLRGANDERLKLQALLDEVAPWPEPALQPQSEVTPERAQAVQQSFEAAARQWEAYKRDSSADQILDARMGEPDCGGTAILDVYRRADLEHQHVEQHTRIEQLEQELAAVERLWAESHNRLAERLVEYPSLLQAVAERGESGGLWRQHQDLEAQRRELEQNLEGLLQVRAEAPPAVTDMPEGAERLQQWRDAEAAAASTALAWSNVAGADRAKARQGFGEHAGTYAAHQAALYRRDALREAVVPRLLMYHLGEAEQGHVAAMQRLGASPNNPQSVKAEVDADAERRRIQGLLDNAVTAPQQVSGPQRQPTAQHVHDAAAHAAELHSEPEAPPDRPRRALEQTRSQEEAPTVAERTAEPTTRLAVPYHEREQARTAGARWSPEERCWHAPAGADLSALRAWMPEPAQPPRNPVQEFAEVIRAAGLVLDGEPIMDGQFHRVPVEGARRGSRDGAYVGHIGDAHDDRAHGYCKNHRTGEEKRWIASGDRPLSVEQRARIVEKQKESGLERDLRHWRRAQQLQDVWQRLPEAQPEHGYLQNKRVACHGLKQDEDGSLVMPLRDANGNVWSLQTITEQGDKRLAQGARKSGCFHAIGELQGAREILICEGYATGASLHRATAKPVVVAVDAGNLKHVEESIRKSDPEAQMAIMADNDHSREVNVGVQKATEAAQAVGAVVVVPELTEAERQAKLTDWNDIEVARGTHGLETELKQRFEQAQHQRAEQQPTAEKQPMRAMPDRAGSSEHPQPERELPATAEGLREAEARLHDRAAAWTEWMQQNPPTEVVRAREADPQCEGTALLEAYLGADVERQRVQRALRIERLDEELTKVEQEYARAQRTLMERFVSVPAVRSAVIGQGEEGALWEARSGLEAKMKALENEMDKLHGIDRGTDHPSNAARDLKGPELGRVWHESEETVSKRATAWALVPDVEKRAARRGVGVHAETYEAYRQARSHRDALREPLVQAVRSLHKEAAVDKAKGAHERRQEGRTVERVKAREPEPPGKDKQPGKKKERGGGGGRGLGL
jgi:phage/plasmid primase-like uncharacterized protein